MKIHIPQPCREDWNKMQPEEQGRYCQVCSKTVVDFTDWEPEAIKGYLAQRREEKVCGRFAAYQLNNPVKPEALNWPALIAVSGLSFLRKIAAMIVVVFGLSTSSCMMGAAGEPKPVADDTVVEASQEADSLIMGKPILPTPRKSIHPGKKIIQTTVMIGSDTVLIEKEVDDSIEVSQLKKL